MVADAASAPDGAPDARGSVKDPAERDAQLALVGGWVAEVHALAAAA